MKTKTKATERTRRQTPLHIAQIPLPGGGVVGITLAPGKYDPRRGHDRSLEADLDAVAQFGPSAMVTLVERFELRMLDIETLGVQTRLRGIDWFHAPIVDVSTPGPEFMSHWPKLSENLRRRLDRGERILVHCRGGLGRAGMIAARLLVERGFTPGEAVCAVRRVRPGAIETAAQERWVSRAA